MAFGQRPGPPATAGQVQELLDLLRDAGHADFRDARGPMGFTQRQAGGRFTRDEAEAFVERLRAQMEEPGPQDAPPAVRPFSAAGPGAAAGPATPHADDRPPAPPAVHAAPSAADHRLLRRLSNVQLATELERRGWIVIPP